MHGETNLNASVKYSPLILNDNILRGYSLLVAGAALAKTGRPNSTNWVHYVREDIHGCSFPFRVSLQFTIFNYERIGSYHNVYWQSSVPCLITHAGHDITPLDVIASDITDFGWTCMAGLV